MKLLLTSNGLCNQSIKKALADLLGKPLAESNLIFVTTASNTSVGDKEWLIDDLWNCKQAGFKDIDIIDIAVSPQDEIKERFEIADVILFCGGDTYYLMEWLETSGVKEMLPELLKTRIYVGISAGSIATAKEILTSSNKLYGEDKDEPSIRGLNFVNFHFRPHLNSPEFPKVVKSVMDKIAEELKVPLYVADDQTAIKVDGDNVEVISEGEYLTYNL